MVLLTPNNRFYNETKSDTPPHSSKTTWALKPFLTGFISIIQSLCKRRKERCPETKAHCHVQPERDNPGSILA